jgi:1-deoxy-D-xylulose-5-phosphate synthase
MAPRDTEELKAMLWASLDYTKGPVAIRYPRGTDSPEKIPVMRQPMVYGKAEVIQEGNKIAILAVGRMTPIAYAAALRLKEKGLDPWVVNMRFVKPLDEELLQRICLAVDRIVCLEDNTASGGFGSAVLEWMHEHGHGQKQVRLFGLPDRFIEQGTMDELFKIVGLDAESIAERIEQFSRT